MIQEYDFEVKYVRGEGMGLADDLSRLKSDKLILYGKIKESKSNAIKKQKWA